MKKLTTLLLTAAAFTGYGYANPEVEPTPTNKTVPEVEKPLIQQSLFDAINGDPQYQILTKALLATELNTVLEGEGPFTIFAPTDEAFEKLPQSTVDMLMKPENSEKLADILKYHVVSGQALSKDVAAGELVTVQGSPVTVKVDGETVMLDSATVTDVDRVTMNGVIHQIDTVLMPSS